MGAAVHDGRDHGLTGTVLCRLDEIPDPGGKGIAPPDRPRFFVVRIGHAVWGYVNSCPHQGVNLDWNPDRFLTRDKDLIQCATHGARFVIQTGRCIAGPCRGRALAPVPVRVLDGAVVLA